MPAIRTQRTRYNRGPYSRGSRIAKERQLPQKYVAPVASIAKRVISHLTERKHLNINRDDIINMLAQAWYYLDPMQFMVVGTGDGQRIGSKVSDCWLHLSFQWNHTSTNWNGSRVRILVIRAEQQLPNLPATWSSTASAGGLFPNLLTNDFQLSNAYPVGHDYTILADKFVVSKRDYNTPNYGTPGLKRFRVKLGNMTYENTAVGGVNYQKGRNVYVLVGHCNAAVSPLDALGTLQFSGM